MKERKDILNIVDNLKRPICENNNFNISYKSKKFGALKKYPREKFHTITMKCNNSKCYSLFIFDVDDKFIFRLDVSYENNLYELSFNNQYSLIDVHCNYNRLLSFKDLEINEHNIPNKEKLIKIVKNIIFQ